MLEQKNKTKQRTQILEALHIRNKFLNLNKINFATKLMYLNVFSHYCHTLN